MTTQPSAPQLPPIGYTFIGYFGPSDHKTAVLNNGNGPIFARQGEVLGGRLEILEIGYESITLRYTDARLRGMTATLPMSSSQ